MRDAKDPATVQVIAPNFKRRLSGVTSTVFRLVPFQARDLNVVVAGPVVPEGIPQIRLRDLVLMPRHGPDGPRVWHARRNVEMLGGLALRALGKDLRLLFTSASQRRHTGFTKWLIRRMDEVVSTSARTAAYLERPSVVVHHGIDTATFQPPADRAALRSELGMPEGPIVGCFGRIRAQKGTDLFVDAMIGVLSERPDGGAILLGRATSEHRSFQQGLETRIAAAGLSDRIRFLGEVPVGDMARWYQALDLFVAPQRWEGFGVTPIEAMACGVPVIATRVGAFEDQVADGVTGRLIPADDLPAMAQAIRDALSDRPRLARWGEAARAHVLGRFRIEDEAAALNALYRDLLRR
ncbi:glycosyltransferase family 4 protein [Rubellimicrobium arenae]|uniref:glycosyltransferase family 4 protein n=1 Tax=Rubellimicrobium arenae TaxID=2817372 RepID=UPI001B30B89F|nr:glycosyltransferase family 4 protein [Rubellimicrobium arenae]